MYRAVEQHCDENAAIVGTVAAFQTAVTNFKIKVAEIIGTEQLSAIAITGIAEDKANLKQMLCQKAADVASIISAYAAANNNNTLGEQVDYSLSKLQKTRDDQLSPLCQNIHDVGNTNLNEIKDFGLSSAILADLQTAITNFSASTPKPRTAMSHRKTHLSNLADLFKATDLILKGQMDKMIVGFKATEPNFVKDYKSNRVIVDPGTTSTQLKGVVYASADDKAIKDATVTIVETGASVTTSATGKYSFKPVPPGTYTVTVTADGFSDFSATGVFAKMGTANVLDVPMLP